MNVPLKIKFNSDQNELEYQNKVKDHYVYKYTKSKTKKDNLLGLTETEISKLIANHIIKGI